MGGGDLAASFGLARRFIRARFSSSSGVRGVYGNEWLHQPCGGGISWNGPMNARPLIRDGG